MAGPMTGFRIVDCSDDLAGMRASGLLADYGAEVIWVEPVGGHSIRINHPIEHAVFNRGKQSIELDLTSTASIETLRSLAIGADVFMSMWSAGRAEELGVDTASLRAANPMVVTAQITGFGSVGPYADLPARELVVQALSGVMGEQFGWREGPVPSAIPVGALGAAYLAVVGIAGALRRARIDGIGRHIETSLFDGALAYLAMLWGCADDAPATTPGAGHVPGTVRMVVRSFRCADDRYIGVHTGAVGAFGRLMVELGVDDRIPPSADGIDIGKPLAPEQTKILLDELPEIFLTRPCDEWVSRLLAADVCAVPHLYPGEVFSEPQALHNKSTVVVDDPVLGPLEQVAPGARFSRSPAEAPKPAPVRGTFDASTTASTRANRPDTAGAAAAAAAADAPNDRPLFDGVKILDFGAYYAGPYSSRVLADLGADVIKLETLAGDQVRGLATVFRAASSNKRSVSADLKRPEFERARTALLEWADVVHHNMRPGAAERLQLGWEQVSARNPRAIYLYAPGWGSTGPDQQRQAFAPMMSGYVGACLEVAGQFNEPTFPLGNEDPGNGLMGAVAMAMALLEREVSGKGQYIENPQLDAAMAHLSHVVRRPDGEILNSMRLDPLQFGMRALERVYQCSDGWVVIDAENDVLPEIDRILELGIANDERFADHDALVANDADLCDIIAAKLESLPATAARDLLLEHGVPAAIPLPYQADAVLRDPLAQRLRRSLGAPAENGVVWRLVGQLVRAPELDDAPFFLAPPIGHDTDAIMATLGYSADEIAELHASRAIR
jgi:crotonobetainyl-CoA:carnitine CoA-transferase CaiB-like acyl-CoA transferase